MRGLKAHSIANIALIEYFRNLLTVLEAVYIKLGLEKNSSPQYQQRQPLLLLVLIIVPVSKRVRSIKLWILVTNLSLVN